MKNAARMFLMVCALVFVASPVFAQPAGEETSAVNVEAAEVATGFSIPQLGAGLIVLGAALGIGRIGGTAVESIARQPEMAGKIQTAMIIAAALIEGLGIIGLFFGK